MSYFLMNLGMFLSKAIIVLLFVLIILVAFFALLSRNKKASKSKLQIKHLNKHYEENRETMLMETLPKKAFKQFVKEQKKEDKSKAHKPHQTVYVINFLGDMKASAVGSLAEEITAILNVAKPGDEVVAKVESAGGVVHGYGLAAAQLMRLRTHKIPLTVCIDKVAASGGYMMASVADRILAAPFAIVGSIGVIIQLPNFHRLLKDKHVDFEQFTAGEFKRTITMFGENTETGRKKLQLEIEDIHQCFKRLVTDNRPQIDIKKVATGEHWLGVQALELNLIDEIRTSDDYLLELSQKADLYEVCFEVKKPFYTKLLGATQLAFAQDQKEPYENIQL